MMKFHFFNYQRKVIVLQIELIITVSDYYVRNSNKNRPKKECQRFFYSLKKCYQIKNEIVERNQHKALTGVVNQVAARWI